MALSQGFIAAAREAFILDGVETPGIRDETLAAWRRSKAAGVAPTGSPDWEIQDDFDKDSSLLRAVRPVSEGLMQELQSSEVAMMVIDRNARIVGRWVNGSLMQRHLDRMGVFPGALFDESCVGSTGLGTPLEQGGLTVIDGTEHYNDSFDAVVAVGVPIIHPGTGVVEGVIDVVSPTGSPVGLMMPLIANAAREAGDRLVTGYAREDRQLLDSFMQTERRGTRRPMIALNSRLMFANHPAGDLLDGRPHTLLWEDVQRALADGRDSVFLGDPADPSALLARIRTVTTNDGFLGAVLQLGPATETEKNTRQTETPSRALSARIVSALPGRSLRWVGAARSVADGLVAGRPLVLTGPAGSGKSILARTAARLWAKDEASVELVDGGSDLHRALNGIGPNARVIVLDQIGRSADSLDVVFDWISSRSAEPMRLVLTLNADASSEVRDTITGRIANVVELPSLAHRINDIGDLVQAWSARREDGGCALEAEALRELMRRSWPGNVRQLFWTLDSAASNRTGLKIRREDLPNLAGPTPRRQLTYLENVEREAIAKLLEASGGRKIEVARELGVSRSTLYRKLAALGLDD